MISNLVKYGVGGLLLFIFIVWGYMYLTRTITHNTIRYSVITPAKHIECVVVTTSDGVATSCNWKGEEK